MIKCEKTETNFKCHRRWRETFYDLGTVHDCNNGISSIHGKESPEQLSIHCEHNRSHTQTNARHVYKVGVWTTMRSQDWKQLVGRIIHGNTCHWLETKESSIFNARRSTFGIMCCVLVRFSKTSQWNDAWEQRLGWLKSSSKYRNFDRIDGAPMEFEWNIFPGFNTLQLNEEVKRLLLKSDETPENFTRRIIFMSMFNDISCGSKDNEKGCLADAKLVSFHVRRFGKGQRSFIGTCSEEKWYCISENSPQGVWDKIAEWMLLEFAESGCPIFRAASPLSRGRLRSKRHGKLLIHNAADLETVETVFRTEVLSKIFHCSNMEDELKTNWANLYGCCWNWTILQDERHCRSLTISCSGLSLIHSSKRRRSITTKRIDPREHKDWVRIRSCNLSPAN